MKTLRLMALLTGVLALAGCAEVNFASHVGKSAFPPSQNEGTFKVGKPYLVDGTWYYPKEQYEYSETGIASYYGPGFHGKHTANGEVFDANEMTAAHRTLQMPSLVRVTNLDNGRSAIVRVNDRGPFKRSRVIDVSTKAAEVLGFKNIGTAKVRLDILSQESLQIAAAARSGLSTKGYEVAANQGTYAIQPGAVYSPQPGAYQVASAQPVLAQDYPIQSDVLPPPPLAQDKPAAIQTRTLSGMTAVVPGHTRYGEFYPDPVVTETRVAPTGIYIQAGAFSSEQNARGLEARLRPFGPVKVIPAVVNAQQFYRVRIGPVANVPEADALLGRVVAAGNNGARIVVE